MKRGTLEHFKTMRLATLLSADRLCDRAEALGLLEALCNHFAPRSAPQGDIGKCTNAEIAAGCHTSRNPDVFVQALLEAGWLDAHPDHRLLIHDWSDHADESVKKFLARHHLPFLTVSGPHRVGVATVSRRRRDTVGPPRAGTGTGSGNGSLNLERERESEGEGFVAFWTAYPKKVGKDDARRAWQKTKRRRPAVPLLLSALEKLKVCDQWQRDGGQYIPHPATWLHRGGWQDEPTATVDTQGRRAARNAELERLRSEGRR